MICMKAKSPISCLIELKDSCNKVVDEITFYPSFNTFYHPCMCWWCHQNSWTLVNVLIVLTKGP